MNCIPTEIKLNILSQAHPSQLNSLASASNQLEDLVKYIISKKLQSHLDQQQQLLISLYSPNSKESNYKYYYTVEYEIQQYTTTFNIGSFHHKENLLKPSTDLTEKQSVQEINHKQLNHLDLTLNEDQSMAKISFALLLDNTPINETSLRLNKQSSSNGIQLENLAFQFSLQQGELEPEKGGYDFDINYNYALNFRNFVIDNVSLLKMIEKDDQALIIRY